MEMLSNQARRVLKSEAESRYQAFVSRGFKIDLSRGNPAPEQLDLSRGLLEAIDCDDFVSSDGVDCRGYAGGVLGITDARHLFAPLLGAPPRSCYCSGQLEPRAYARRSHLCVSSWRSRRCGALDKERQAG